MTEDEMKLTWCPDARVVEVAQDSNGGFVGDEQSWNRRRYTSNTGKVEECMTHCLGRKCSSWRWDDVPNPAYAEFRKKHSSLSLMVDWSTSPPATIKSATDGHCGRAGRP